MALTAREENILRKMTEVEQARRAWNTTSEVFSAAMRAAADERRATLATEIATMDTQYAALQAREAELKALTRA